MYNNINGEVIMKEKYYELTSYILIGISLIIFGTILLIGKPYTYQHLIDTFILILWMNSLKEFWKFIFKKRNNKEETTTLLSCIFHLLICLILTLVPSISIRIISYIFSIYIIIIGLTQLIMSIIEIKNGELVQFKHIIISIICFYIGIPILISPLQKINNLLTYLSIYSILLGTSMLLELISKKTKNKLKRHIRITLPKIIEAIIPYTIMTEINRNLALEKTQIYSFDKTNKKSDLNILIHTANRGFNKMGHIDICIDEKVYSFGNYDEGSRICKELIGEGVLFITEKKEEYINFCIENSKKTIFDFGIVLTNIQKKAIKKRINEIMKNTINWNYMKDRNYLNNNTYASKLYKKTNAKFYKFKKGKYHTYFVVGTNCCTFVDDVVGKSGMDILSINGIITPGTYYDFLNKELKLKNGNIISKEIYNKERMLINVKKNKINKH